MKGWYGRRANEFSLLIEPIPDRKAFVMEAFGFKTEAELHAFLEIPYSSDKKEETQ